MTSAEHGHPVKAFGSNRPDPAFCERVALGYRTGVLITRMPWEANTSSKLAVNLASRSRTRNLMDRPRSSRSPARFRASGYEGTGWMVGDPEDLDLPGREVDREEHVELAQRHGVDGEEIHGQSHVSLGPQELGPRGSLPGHRSETMAAEDPTDRARRDADPELSELTLDAHASPRRFSRPRRTISSTSSSLIGGRPGPRCARHRRHLRGELTVPAEEGLGVTRKVRNALEEAIDRARINEARPMLCHVGQLDGRGLPTLIIIGEDETCTTAPSWRALPVQTPEGTHRTDQGGQSSGLHRPDGAGRRPSSSVPSRRSEWLMTDSKILRDDGLPRATTWSN